MDDGLRPGIPERRAEFVRLAQAALDERGAPVHGRAMPLGKIVVNADFMSGVEEFLHADRANISRSAGDKHIHVREAKAAGARTQPENA